MGVCDDYLNVLITTSLIYQKNIKSKGEEALSSSHLQSVTAFKQPLLPES
jgi:hypothetical protein